MREFLKRNFPTLEKYLEPYLFGSNANNTPANTTYSPREEPATSSRSLPRSSLENSVVPWSPSSRTADLDHDDSFSDLEEMIRNTRRTSLALHSQTMSSFPSSAGLVTYYSQTSHLEYLNHGIVPANISNALSNVNYSTTTTIATSVRNPSLEISLSKMARTPISRVDALDSLQCKVLLPPSPIKPSFMTEEQFIECCAAATFIHLLKKGYPMEDLVLLQNIFRGLPGKNITNLQFLAAHLSALKVPVDFREHLSPQLLDILPAENIEKLGTLTLTKDATYIHEILAMAQINSQQASQLSFTGAIRNSMGYPTPPWFYNNSGNTFPDYRLTLREPVGPYTHIGMDYKMTRRSRGNCDIIKGCSDNLEHNVVQVNRELQRNVLNVLKNPNLSERDQHLANAMLAHIDQNTANYNNTKDITHYVLCTNELRETHSDFLIRNRLGVNLISTISLDDMCVNSEVKEEFARSFKHFYLSEESSLLKYLNARGRNENIPLMDTKHTILAFAEQVFSDQV